MAIEERHVTSIHELTQQAISIAHLISPPENAHYLPAWFRGHSSSSYRLLPKLLREGGRTVEQVRERERRLITRFRQRSLAYWPAGYPQDDWEHLFTMQHYGVSTRLLDWSENLYIAAYFALSEPSAQSPQETDDHPVIWMFCPTAWNATDEQVGILSTSSDALENYKPSSQKRSRKRPLCIYGSHNSNRIVAQRGTFMVWGDEIADLETQSATNTCTLFKLILTEDRAKLFNDLQRLGFSETMVFPELSSLASEINRSEGWRS